MWRRGESIVVAVRFERFASPAPPPEAVGDRGPTRSRGCGRRRDDAVRTENCATLCVFTLLFILRILEFLFFSVLLCNAISIAVVSCCGFSIHSFTLARCTPSLRRNILICPYAYCSRVDSLLGCVGRPQSILRVPDPPGQTGYRCALRCMSTKSSKPVPSFNMLCAASSEDRVIRLARSCAVPTNESGRSAKSARSRQASKCRGDSNSGITINCLYVTSTYTSSIAGAWKMRYVCAVVTSQSHRFLDATDNYGCGIFADRSWKCARGGTQVAQVVLVSRILCSTQQML